MNQQLADLVYEAICRPTVDLPRLALADFMAESGFSALEVELLRQVGNWYLKPYRMPDSLVAYVVDLEALDRGSKCLTWEDGGELSLEFDLGNRPFPKCDNCEKDSVDRADHEGEMWCRLCCIKGGRFAKNVLPHYLGYEFLAEAAEDIQANEYLAMTRDGRVRRLGDNEEGQVIVAMESGSSGSRIRIRT